MAELKKINEIMTAHASESPADPAEAESLLKQGRFTDGLHLADGIRVQD